METNRKNSASPAAVESTGVDDAVSAMSNIEITERRNREKALKRPMPTLTPDPEPAGNQEPEIYKWETHKVLAEGIPEEYKKVMNFMGARSWPWLVAEKRLRKGDLEDRLVIPARTLRCKFSEELKREKQLRVQVIDPHCTVSLLPLTAEKAAAEAAGAAAYVVSDWSGIVERSNLKEGDLIELWRFHVGNALCLLILHIDEDDQGYFRNF